MADHSRTYAIGRRRWIAFGMLAVAVVALATVVSFSTTVAASDAALGSLARTARWGSLLAFSTDVSALASTDLIVPVTAAAVAVLAVVRHWHGALTLALSVLATQAVVHLVKVLVERPRPAANEAIAGAAGNSFPSAHSATAVALYATLALVVAHRCTGWVRATVLGAGGAVVVAIGLSRIQLGAHYPIDVVAGWLTGAALVLAIWALVGRLAVRPGPRPA
jgi:membrane-associated phospholipid phosphatase